MKKILRSLKMMVEFGTIMDLVPFLVSIIATGTLLFVITISGSHLFGDKSGDSVDKYRLKFFQLADELLNRKDTANLNIETLKFGFNSINRESDNKLLNYGFVNTLEDYLVYLVSNKKITNEINYKNTLLIIKKEIELEPFSQLLSDQRRVLKNLELSISRRDSTTSKYNLVELNDILLNLNGKNLFLQKQNNWSIPLAIVGVVITLIFGIITILSPLSYRKMRKIIKESFPPSS